MCLRCRAWLGKGRDTAVTSTLPPRHTTLVCCSALGICPGSVGIRCDVNWGQREGASLARQSGKPPWGAEVRSFGTCRCCAGADGAVAASRGGSLGGCALT